MTQIDRQKYLREIARAYGLPLEVVQTLAQGLGPRALQSNLFLKELRDYYFFDRNRNDDNKGE